MSFQNIPKQLQLLEYIFIISQNIQNSASAAERDTIVYTGIQHFEDL